MKSLWQKYEIFEDRVELHTKWAGTFKIPFDQIERVEVYPPVLRSLLLHIRHCLPIGIKLDAADINEHVILDKNSGLVRHLLFTPEDPAEFKRVIDERLTQFNENQAPQR